MSSTTNNPPGGRELVFCHPCQEEWYRDQHGLICPYCNGDFVEIIENDQDPRPQMPGGLPDLPEDFGVDEGDGTEPRRDRLPATFVRVDGPHFSFTSTQRFGTRHGGLGRTESGEPGGNEDPNDLMLQLFTNMFRNIMGDGLTPGARATPDGTPTNEQQNTRGGNGESPPPGAGSRGAHPHPHIPSIFGPHIFSGGTVHYDTSSRLGPRDANAPQPAAGDVLDLQTIISNLVASDTNGIFRVLGSPGAGGDYVYSQVELDRVISGLMEQHQGNAPPPAPREVIESLPKIKVDQAMVADGADCAVCKEDLILEEEVANLPCKHKYHFECVKKWLEAHDTCPICRHPVTPEHQRPQPPPPRPHIITTPWSLHTTPSHPQPSGPPPAPENSNGHASGSRGSGGGWASIFRRSGGSGQ